jgi:hypothetical protein
MRYTRPRNALGSEQSADRSEGEGARVRYPDLNLESVRRVARDWETDLGQNTGNSCLDDLGESLIRGTANDRLAKRINRRLLLIGSRRSDGTPCSHDEESQASGKCKAQNLL